MRLGVRVLVATMLAFMSLSVVVRAQEARIYGLEVGYRNPKATQSGFSIGGFYGIMADEAVDLSMGFDLFNRSYSRLTEVASEDFASGVHETTVQKDLEYKTTILPIFGTITIRMPMQYSLSGFLQGSVGYSFLFNRERNYQDGIEAKRTYRGMSWKVGGGALYRLGSRSQILFGIYYHSAEVSREKKESPRGLPIWKSVDLSGIGLRLGLRLESY